MQSTVGHRTTQLVNLKPRAMSHSFTSVDGACRFRKSCDCTSGGGPNYHCHTHTSNAPLPPLEVLVSTHLAIPVALDLGPGPRTMPLTSDHGPGTKANHSHRSLVNSFPLSLGSSAPVSASALPGWGRGWWQRRSLSVLDLRDPHPTQDSAPMHVHRPCGPRAIGEIAFHGQVEHADMEHGLQEASMIL